LTLTENRLGQVLIQVLNIGKSKKILVSIFFPRGLTISLQYKYEHVTEIIK
jgi:hypothetical protein